MRVSFFQLERYNLHVGWYTARVKNYFGADSHHRCRTKRAKALLNWLLHWFVPASKPLGERTRSFSLCVEKTRHSPVRRFRGLPERRATSVLTFWDWHKALSRLVPDCKDFHLILSIASQRFCQRWIESGIERPSEIIPSPLHSNRP